MSIPSSVIDPDEGAYHLSSRATTVLLPLPLAPTKAVVLPAGMEMLKSRSTGAPGREGYAKARFVISKLPSQLSIGIFPDSSSGSSSDFLSITLKSSDAAAAALMNAWIWGTIVETEVAAIRAAKITLSQSVSIGFSYESLCSREDLAGIRNFAALEHPETLPEAEGDTGVDAEVLDTKHDSINGRLLVALCVGLLEKLVIFLYHLRPSPESMNSPDGRDGFLCHVGGLRIDANDPRLQGCVDDNARRCEKKYRRDNAQSDERELPLYGQSDNECRAEH